MIDTSKIWTSSQLPTLPLVAMKLVEISKQPETGAKDIARLIKTDPAISAKILTAVNSASAGIGSDVSSIDQAVPLLGMTEVTALAISFSLAKDSASGGSMAGHYKNYWTQSVVQAAAAELLGKKIQRGLEHEYFLAGLLVDFGRLAMLKTISDEYRSVLEQWSGERKHLYSIESEVLGVNHIEVGMKLMHECNLPGCLIRMVEFHHAPLLRLFGEMYAPDFDMIKAIAVSASVGDFYCSNDKGRALARISKLGNDFFGFSEADVEDFIHQTDDRISEVSRLLSVEKSKLPDLNELLAQADEQLADLAKQLQTAGNRQ